MKTAKDLILELYKTDHITKKETQLLLDAIKISPPVQIPYVQPIQLPYVDWTYRPYVQPSWTITSDTNTSNVE